MNENVYYIKYLKYKMKYLKEKEMQIGGGETEKSIFFFSKSVYYRFLSNFFPCKFTDPLEKDEHGKLIVFNCNEQYFMYHKAKKFDPEKISAILKETVPREIQKLGGRKSIRNFVEADWNTVKLEIMKRGLELKFSQNKVLKKLLIATGTKTLYEANENDPEWGIGLDEVAAMAKETAEPLVVFPGNALGKLLMDVRKEFIENPNFTVK